MNKVFACIDGVADSAAVVDCAAWCASRLNLPLMLLHALERPPQPDALTDLSGALGLGAQDDLLRELGELDARRSVVAREVGRMKLAAARERASAAGATQVDESLRHGELLDAVLDAEPDARLFVMGTHHQARDRARFYLDHRLERVVRSVRRPVLTVTGDHFVPPQRLVIAFDGSATARTMIANLAASPLLAGIPALLATAGEATEAAHAALAEAGAVLSAGGLDVETQVLPGEPEAVFPALLGAKAPSLLVMGAYGHSRLRQLVVGSTTTALLRLSEMPVLVLR